MAQTVLAFALVAVAAVYLVRRLRAAAKGDSHAGCDKCGDGGARRT